MIEKLKKIFRNFLDESHSGFRKRPSFIYSTFTLKEWLQKKGKIT